MPIKLKEDILFQSELKQILGKNYINILSTAKESNMASGRIDFSFLEERIKNLDQYFYICGPLRFEKDVKKKLEKGRCKNEIYSNGI